MSKRLQATCTNPDRPDGTFVIGISTKLDLTITNSGTEDLDLAIGTPGQYTKEAANDRTHPNPSAFYVYLDQVADPTCLEHLDVSAPAGFGIDFYRDDKGNGIWVITAVEASTSPLKSKATTTIHFSRLTITGASRNAPVVVDPRVIPGFIGSLRAEASVLEPSSASPLPVTITAARTDPAPWVGEPDVIYTICDELPVTNTVSLTIRNDNPQDLLVSGWKDTAPTFTITFAYADAAPGDGALTTPAALVAPFEMAQGDTHGQDFVGPDSDARNYPSWLLRPSASNQAVLKPSTQEGVVEIVIKDLAIPLCEGPTALFITSSHFPGYADSAWVLPLSKEVPTPRFNQDPQPLTPSSTTAFAPGLCPPLEVSWDAFGATAFDVKWVEGTDLHSATLPAPASTYTLDPQPSTDGVSLTGLTVSANGIAGPTAEAPWGGPILIEQLLPMLIAGGWGWMPFPASYLAFFFGADRSGSLLQADMAGSGPPGVRCLPAPWSFDQDKWLLNAYGMSMVIDKTNRLLICQGDPNGTFAFVGDDPTTRFITSGIFSFAMADPPNPEEGVNLIFTPSGFCFYLPWGGGYPDSGMSMGWEFDGDHNVHLWGQSTDLTLIPNTTAKTLTANNGAVFTQNPFPT